jgi:hypothetical protein
MVNRLYNKQVSPKGYMKGGRVNKMGGGMMMKKRPMMEKGGKLKMVEKGGKKVPFFAADGKGSKDLGKADRMMAKKGSIPPQLKKFVMAKKKKAKMKKMKKKVIG